MRSVSVSLSLVCLLAAERRMVDEARDLAAQVRTARSKRSPSGFPPELRRRAGLWLAEARSRGETWEALGAVLGVSSTTASNWARSSGTSEGGFLPVQTEPAPVPTAVPAATSASPPSEPVLVTPRGYRVEGLDVERLLAVLERLG